ncbi:MAG: hypothetical protein ACK4GL_04065 [Flavobacteriales bacterium]
MSVPSEVRLSDAEPLEHLIIEDSKILVAEIPVGITKYNLCFGDTLQMLQDKTTLAHLKLSLEKPYQLAEFEETTDNVYRCALQLFFENGRLVAISNRIKLLLPELIVNTFVQCDQKLDGFKSCQLKKISDEEYIYESFVVNLI